MYLPTYTALLTYGTYAAARNVVSWNDVTVQLSCASDTWLKTHVNTALVFTLVMVLLLPITTPCAVLVLNTENTASQSNINCAYWVLLCESRSSHTAPSWLSREPHTHKYAPAVDTRLSGRLRFVTSAPTPTPVDGTTDGATDGATEGAADDATDGSSVNSKGCAVVLGCALGPTLGRTLGTTLLGPTVGTALGAPVTLGDRLADWGRELGTEDGDELG